MTIRFGPGPPPPARRRPLNALALYPNLLLGYATLIFGGLL